MSKLFFRLLCLKLNFLKQVGPSCFLFIEKLTVGLPSVSPRVSAPQYRRQVSPVIAADGTLVLFSFILVFVHLLIHSFVCLPSSALLLLFIHLCYMIFCNTGTFNQYSVIPILLIQKTAFETFFSLFHGEDELPGSYIFHDHSSWMRSLH